MLQLRRPTKADRRKAIETAATAAIDHPVRGRPAVREETIGWGIKRYDRARNALARLEQFNVPGTIMVPSALASPGRRFVVFARRLGVWTSAPVEVTSFDTGERSITCTLRTLGGHPLAGEETFTIIRRPNGIVRFRIEAVSRPSTNWARAFVPIIRLLQVRYRRSAIEHMRNATGVARSSVTR